MPTAIQTQSNLSSQSAPGAQSIQTQIPSTGTYLSSSPPSQSGDLSTFLVVVAVTVLAKVLMGQNPIDK